MSQYGAPTGIPGYHGDQLCATLNWWEKVVVTATITLFHLGGGIYSLKSPESRYEVGLWGIKIQVGTYDTQ